MKLIFEALEYIAKYPLKIEDKTTTAKVLQKIAIYDKDTDEWKLKRLEKIK